MTVAEWECSKCGETFVVDDVQADTHLRFCDGPPGRVSSPPRTVYVGGLSVRVARRRSVFIGLATGRYWATGADHTPWHSDARLPFLHVGIVRALPDRRPRIRATFMGWRGADWCPAPDLREFYWPKEATDV